MSNVISRTFNKAAALLAVGAAISAFVFPPAAPAFALASATCWTIGACVEKCKHYKKEYTETPSSTLWTKVAAVSAVGAAVSAIVCPPLAIPLGIMSAGAWCMAEHKRYHQPYITEPLPTYPTWQGYIRYHDEDPDYWKKKALEARAGGIAHYRP